MTRSTREWADILGASIIDAIEATDRSTGVTRQPSTYDVAPDHSSGVALLLNPFLAVAELRRRQNQIDQLIRDAVAHSRELRVLRRIARGMAVAIIALACLALWGWLR